MEIGPDHVVLGVDRRHFNLEQPHALQADRLVEAGALAQHLGIFLVIGAALHCAAGARRNEVLGIARADRVGVDVRPSIERLKTAM